MTYYTEPAKKLLLNEEYDLIVVGSGPSGIASAVTAGRRGIKTLLIESQGTVGGIATAGLMSHFTGYCGSALFHEILDRMEKENIFPMKEKIYIEPETLKGIYFKMLAEAGVDVLLYTFACGVIVEENTLRGIIVENKSGRSAYAAKAVIDCTGDGDIAERAGVPYCLGRESDHRMQPATLMFKIAGVDTDRAVFPGSFESLVYTEKGELQALAKEKLPHPAGHVLLYRSPVPGVVTCNMTNATGIDGTKAESLTDAEKICRSQIAPIVSFLREYVPGYENCYPISSASLIGIRETRHFEGVYTLTENDILEARQFDEAVVFDAFFNFDVHNLTGASLDETGCQKHFPQKRGYTIPYNCMLPKKLDGLLLSGRNISGTHLAHSNYRVMPICVGIGEACGAAAAIAIKKNIPLRSVSPEEIRHELGRE